MTTQNIKPILFSTEMVQAILAGRKTQTRRLTGLQKINSEPDAIGLGNVRLNGFFNFYRKATEKGIWIMPTVKTGDVLWVRETFTQVPETAYGCKFIYKATFDRTFAGPWKPSLFMPKEAARIFLKVTDVRAERLMDVPREDCFKEGIAFKERWVGRSNMRFVYDYEKKTFAGDGSGRITPSQSFRTLWDSINGKKHSWESNPWVWVYTFEQTEKPENFLS